MPYQTLSEFNATGAEGLFIYAATISPIFIPLLLFAFFMIILLGSFFSQRRTSGRGNFFASFAVAGYATTIVSFAMALIPDLINTLTVVVVVSATIFGTIMLLMSKER